MPEVVPGGAGGPSPLASSPGLAMRHPALRVLSFLLLLVWVGRLPPWGEALWLAALAAAAVLHPRLDGRALGRALGAGAWLYGTALVIYLWWTPGIYLWPALGRASPTWEGLWQGGARALLLACFVATVNLFMQWTPRQQVFQGIYGLLHPLGRLGLPVARGALRLALVLELADRLPDLRDRARRALGGEGHLPVRLARALGEIYDYGLRQAEAEPPRRMVLSRPGRPAAGDWLAPLSLALLIALS